MILATVTIPAKHLKCDLCGWPDVPGRKHPKPWLSISDRLPDFCPNRACRSREWNGKKTRAVPKRVKIDLPKPKRVKEMDDEF